MKHLLKGSLSFGVALIALAGAANAQTVVFNGIGSSGLFLELGEATSNSTSGLSPLPECIWSTAKSSDLFATDPTTSDLTEKGQAWIAWTAGTSGKVTDCQTVNSSTKIYAYLQTDSVIGDRCLFNGCYITNTLPSTQATANLIWPKTNTGTTVIAGEEVEYLPSAIAAAFTKSAPVNVAGTDIRPEDAEFATTRALAPCGDAIAQYTNAGQSTQYLGLGYTNGSSVNSYFSTSTFHIVKFTLPSTFYVSPVGIDPIVFATNSTDAANTGFNTGFTSTSLIQNISRQVLAKYLDGTIGETRDAITPGASTAGYTSKPTAVLVREPVSGTYNTVEYNVPNTVESQTSQDVGSNQPTATRNCNGTAPEWNAEGTPMATLVDGAVRERAIGTSEELAQTFANNDTLGYGFWSVGNFAAAPATSKYLSVDGVDPLFPTYSTSYGAIPTSTSALEKVTFSHVIDGTYPVWSLVRLVTKSTTQEAVAQQIALAAAKYSNPKGHPDFVPYYTTTGGQNLAIERVHFTPPGIYKEGAAPAPQDGDGGAYTEVGGDVGGLIIPIQVDSDYITDTGVNNGYTGTISSGQGVPTTLGRD